MAIPINETLLTNFPPKNKTGKQQLVQYIQNAPFMDGHWKVLKGLYKKLEEQPIAEALTELIYKIDKISANDLEYQYPSEKTLGYMKRRAARYLRGIATTSPALYIEIVVGLLKKQKNEIDLDHQWVMGNILLGSSKRLSHSRHGRGKMKIAESDSDICRREEKNPEIWDQHLYHLQNLLQSDELASLVYAFAIKGLIRNKKPLPTFSNRQLACFFHSSSPWLKQVAANQCYQTLLSGNVISSQFLAQAFFYSPADRRSWFLNVFFEPDQKEDKPTIFKVLTAWLLPANKTAPSPSFKELIKHIAELTFENLQTPIRNRIKSAAKVLVQYKEQVDTSLLAKHFKIIIESGNNDLITLALDGASKSKYTDIKDWLKGAENAPESIKTHLFDLFEKKIKINRHSVKLLSAYIYDDSKVLAHFGWLMIAKLKNASNIVQTFWGSQYWRGHLNKPFQNMVSSKHACELIVTYCQNRLRWIGWHYNTIIYLIKNAQSPLKEATYKLMKEKVKQDVLSWINYLVDLEDDRDKIMHHVWPHIEGSRINKWNMMQLIMNDNEWIKMWGWRILEEKKATQKCVQYISAEIMKDYGTENAMKFANKMLNHPNKNFAKWFTLSLKNEIEKSPHYIDKFISFIHLFINEINPSSMLKMIEAAPDEKWKQIRLSTHLYSMGKNGTSFWKKVLKKVEKGEARKLFHRTLNDGLFLKSFYLIEDDSILDEKSPILGDLIFNWVQAQEVKFTKGSTMLLKACKHPIEKVRHWATKRMQQVGMDLIEALQLMESGVPDAFKLGKSFFDAALDNSSEELENVLALCDSPQKEVRDYGIKYMKERSANLKSSMALACLSEHADPIIQEFVATQLKENVEKDDFVRVFDKGVLRAKNQSRKAKQIIKQRLEENLDVDAETLVELARSKNKQDAEWAILQLTKLALSGQDTAAFELN